MKEVETEYMNEVNTKKNKGKQEIIKEKEINYDSVIKILKKNVGIEIDNFLKINMGQKITAYNADSFTRLLIIALETSKQEIVKEFEKILNMKKW